MSRNGKGSNERNRGARKLYETIDWATLKEDAQLLSTMCPSVCPDNEALGYPCCMMRGHTGDHEAVLDDNRLHTWRSK